MASSIEARLQKLEVYADENAQDIENRVKNMEYVTGIIGDAVIISNRVQAIEDTMSEIPKGLIDNWTKVKDQMNTWHTEESERKDAVRALWKRMDELKAEVTKMQESIETASNGGEMEDIKITMASELKDVYVEIKRIEDETRGSRYGREEKSGKIEWDHKMKRADFNKPGKWKDNDKSHTFEIYSRSEEMGT